MVLYASINREYVNEDLRVNKEVVKRQFAHVATSSKTYIPSSQLDQNMMFNFDKLFEDFRGAVESILSANAEDELTLTKSYEIIKKFNYLSSYLKNIMKISTLSERDSTKIQAKFTEMVPNLTNLYELAVTNNFIDKGEIKAMLDSIQNLQFYSIDAGKIGESVTTNINERKKYINMVKEVNIGLPSLIKDVEGNDELKDKFATQLQEMSEFFEDEQEDIKKYLSSSKTSKLTQTARAELMETFDHNYEIYKTIKDIIDQQKVNKDVDEENELINADNKVAIVTNIHSLINKNKEVTNSIMSIDKAFTQERINKMEEMIHKQFERKYYEVKMKTVDGDELNRLADESDIEEAEMKQQVNASLANIEKGFSRDRQQYEGFAEKVKSEYEEFRSNNAPFDINAPYDMACVYLKRFEDIHKEIEHVVESILQTSIPGKLTIAKTPLKVITPQKKKEARPVKDVKQNKGKADYLLFVNAYRKANNDMDYHKAMTEIRTRHLWDKYKSGTYKIPTKNNKKDKKVKQQQEEEKYNTPKHLSGDYDNTSDS